MQQVRIFYNPRDIRYGSIFVHLITIELHRMIQIHPIILIPFLAILIHPFVVAILIASHYKKIPFNVFQWRNVQDKSIKIESTAASKKKSVKRSRKRRKII
jgi:hypothetical protein